MKAKNNFLNGISNINQLGSITDALKSKINDNKKQLEKLVKQGVNGLGSIQKKNNKLSFSEVLEKYNAGISNDEIKAWVFYKRSLGIPMHGWEKFFISNGKTKQELLYTTQTTVIKDNHFRNVKTIPTNSKLGKFTGKILEHTKTDSYKIFRNEEGLFYVNSKHAKIKDTETLTVSDTELTKLVNNFSLFYSNGELLPQSIFTFGNIYEKLKQLDQDKEYINKNYNQDVYDYCFKILMNKKPKQLSIYDANINNRPSIQVYSEFAKDYKVLSLREDTGIEFKESQTLPEAFIKWLYTLSAEYFLDSNANSITSFFVYAKSPTANFLESFVKARISEIKKADPTQIFSDDRKAQLTKEIRTDIKAAAQNEGEKLFSKFLAEALQKPIQDDINSLWNAKFNGNSEIDYTKIPIGCELSRTWNNLEWAMKPVQKEGVAFFEAVGSGILSFDVGVGKTLTAIVEIAQSLHDGKCKRPLLAVPNSVYNQFKTQIIGEYDKKGNLIKTGILTGIVKLNDWGNLGKSKPGISIEKLDVSKVDEGTITIVTHGGLSEMGFSQSVAEEFIQELTDIIIQKDSQNTRDEEKQGQKIAETIGAALSSNIVKIDKVGFDYLVIDEAHNFKNVFAAVKAKKENGDDKQATRRFQTTSGSVSKRGIKAFFISNYIQRKFGKNVLLMTATPFTNAPIEVYSMLSLVGYDTMKQRNIQNLNDFFELHVNETQEDVVTIKGTIESRPVVKSFNNRMLLQSLIFNHIIRRDAEGKYRPCKIVLPRINYINESGELKKLKSDNQILTYLKMNEWQIRNQKSIINDIDVAIKEMRATKGKGGGLGAIGKAMSDSLNNAFSPFLYERIEPDSAFDFVDQSPKLKYVCDCISTIKKHHKNKKEETSGSIIYINRAKEYFHYIKEYLETEIGFKKNINYKSYCLKQGFDENEISDINGSFDEVEIITGGVSAQKKDDIKEAFNKGVIKVLIGTSTISEGMDLQSRGTNIFNCYPEYNPTQLHQLDGRIWRDGNPNGYIRTTLPLVQNSMDVFIFQKLEEKTSRLRDLWFRADNGNTLEQTELDPEEIKFALITNIEDLVWLEIDKSKKIVERKVGIISANIDSLKDYSSLSIRYNSLRDKVINEVNTWAKNIGNYNYIQNVPTKEERKNISKENLTLYDTDLKLYTYLQEQLAKGNAIEDRELSNSIRKLENRITYFNSSWYNYYIEVKTIIKASEKIIIGLGFSITDDFEKIMDSLKSNLSNVRAEFENLSSKEYFEQIKREMEIKKTRYNVQGKTIQDRVDEFASLNYLLDFKISDRVNACMLPSPKNKKNNNNAKNEDQDKKLFLLKLRARALKLKLQLLEL